MLETADEGFLQDVLGFIARPHPALQKGQEPGVILQQDREHLGGPRVTRGPIRSSGAERPQLVYSHPQPQSQLPSGQGQSGPQVQPLQPQVHSWLKSFEFLIVLSSQGSTKHQVFIPANVRPAGLLHLAGPRAGGSRSWSGVS